MSLGKIWLGLNGIIFFAYGVVCLFSPETPAEYAGIVLPGASAETEIRAMYGGLQAALGAFLILCALNEMRSAEGLRVMVFLLGGLAIGRAFGLLLDGATSYNLYALVYEATASLIALLALTQSEAGTEAE